MTVNFHQKHSIYIIVHWQHTIYTIVHWKHSIYIITQVTASPATNQSILILSFLALVCDLVSLGHMSSILGTHNITLQRLQDLLPAVLKQRLSPPSLAQSRHGQLEARPDSQDGRQHAPFWRGL